MQHVSRIEINLDNLVANYRSVQSYVSPSLVIPVVKGNAYGHGALAMSRALVEAGANRLAVARIDEAAELRRAGIGPDVEVILMTVTLPEEIESAATIDASVFVPDLWRLRFVKSLAKRLCRAVRFHIKVDTGMGRIGFMPEDAPAVAKELEHLEGARLMGIGTHLSASWLETEQNQRQFERFMSFVSEVSPTENVLLHVAASSGVARFPEMFMSAVRTGGLMYGLSRLPTPFELRPVAEYKTRVGQVRHLPAGWHLGYGVDNWVKEPMTTATLPVGSVDGLSSNMVGKAQFLVNGRRCRLVAVCTDNCMIDIRNSPGTNAGDEVVIFGAQGDDRITTNEMIAANGTGFGEFVGKIGLRVPRIYYREGQVAGRMSLFGAQGIACATHG
ncbi:MAG: alanine racemase [Bacillota bacterium]|nr:alanine racemase [Bacillota bacterium]